ncbi:MAG: hypothetical protein GYA35_09570, partial [Thermoanaerobaculaceae bacterium]|nr:hypothetical protein [Thermoanaerobaculaceae bacterium]
AAHYLFAYGGFDPSSSTGGAYGLFYKEVLRQSYLKAFVDVFHFLVIIFILLTPFVFLLKGKVQKDNISIH